MHLADPAPTFLSVDPRPDGRSRAYAQNSWLWISPLWERASGEMRQSMRQYAGLLLGHGFAEMAVEVGIEQVCRFRLVPGHEVPVEIDRDVDVGVPHVGRDRLGVRPCGNHR